MLKLGFIGAGTVGTALAVRLSEKGYPVVSVASRSLSSARRLAAAVAGCRPYLEIQEAAGAADLVFITTPDGAIPQVVAQVHWREGQRVVHCSGADSVDVLLPAKSRGALTGAFHPLQTFAGVAQAIANLPGSTFALEAEEPLLGELKKMAQALEGNCIELAPGDKTLYHLAAVLVCNYLVTLVKMSTDLWQLFGVPPDKATQALMPLLQGTLNNIETVGLPNCLTGPIARGDLGTIQKHLRAMEERAPQLLNVYKELGLQAIPVALAKGKVGLLRAEEMKALLCKEESSRRVLESV